MMRGQKKTTSQQEPRGRFSVQLLRTENRHVPDCLWCLGTRWRRHRSGGGVVGGGCWWQVTVIYLPYV